MLYKVFMPKVGEFRASLAHDAVPKGAPLDYNPKNN